jgi:hypothetical protein
MIIDDLDLAIYEASEQRSANWIDVRLGRFTASEFWRLMSTPRGKSEEHLSDTAITYVEEKVAEILTKQKKVATSWAIDWGTEQEQPAKQYYEKLTGHKIAGAGFVAFGEHAGGSPDGYMPEQLVEIKCPYNSENHVQFMRCTNGLDLKVMEPKYYWQVQANLLFTASKGIIDAVFISYDPRVIAPEQRLHYFTIEPDKDAFELIGIKLGAAIKLKEQIIEELKIK